MTIFKTTIEDQLNTTKHARQSFEEHEIRILTSELEWLRDNHVKGSWLGNSKEPTGCHAMAQRKNIAQRLQER